MTKWCPINTVVLISLILLTETYVRAEEIPRQIGHEAVRPFDAGQSEPYVQRQISQLIEYEGEVIESRGSEKLGSETDLRYERNYEDDHTAGLIHQDLIALRTGN